MKAQIKEPVGVTLQSSTKNAMCVARWGIMLRTAISVKIKGPRKALKPTLLKRKNFHVNNIDLFAVISEVNLVGGDTKE